VTSQQRDATVTMGRPFVDGSRVAVEWWTTMVSEGEEVTLPGCLLLQLEPDGRCSDLREYWNFAPGRTIPSRTGEPNQTDAGTPRPSSCRGRRIRP
jgi:hypothetical protein